MGQLLCVYGARSRTATCNIQADPRPVYVPGIPNAPASPSDLVINFIITQFFFRRFIHTPPTASRSWIFLITSPAAACFARESIMGRLNHTGCERNFRRVFFIINRSAGNEGFNLNTILRLRTWTPCIWSFMRLKRVSGRQSFITQVSDKWEIAKIRKRVRRR